MRPRLREGGVAGGPEEKRLLMEALRVMPGRKGSEPREAAERIKAVMDALGEQLGVGTAKEPA
jgi:hypothetical protein